MGGDSKNAIFKSNFAHKTNNVFCLFLYSLLPLKGANVSLYNYISTELPTVLLF